MNPRSEFLPATSQVRTFSKLQEDILRVFLYFDIFKYPLKAEEVYTFLSSDSTSPGEIAAACTARPLDIIIHRADNHYFVRESGDSSNFPSLRLENERRARTYLSIARFLGKLINTFPFVRGVFISGELSKGVLTRQGDIDFFIVTAPNRLWIARALLTAFKKTFLLNSKKFFCLNHFITEDYLEVTERNLYSALEIATLKPLYNIRLFDTYRDRNSWVKDYFPNLQFSKSYDSETPSRPIVQRLFEAPFKGDLADKLDLKIMQLWRKLWIRRYSDLPQEKREALFRCERFISTAYAGDFRSKVFKEYRIRLERFGLTLRGMEE